MNKILNDIFNNIKIKKIKLDERIKQLSYCNNDIKFFYSNDITEIKNEIIDLEAQIIYYRNLNDSNTIDLHGSTRYFVMTYLEDLLIYKMNYYNKVSIITGKGTFVIFNAVKKYLTNNNYNFTINNYIFIVDIQW